MTQNHRDIVVVGGGIVGCAVAHEISNRLGHGSVLLLEKEQKLAAHQTGRNSGVIHSGIYYKPGSLKATTCRAGKVKLETFCAEHGILHERCGKIVVATEERELPKLADIASRATANGVQCSPIDGKQIRELEPHARGIRGLHVPETGIVDYIGVVEKLKDILTANGNSVETGQEARAIECGASSITVTTQHGRYEAGRLVNCGGLHCDRIARMAGLQPEVQIVPFRGEYYEVTGEAAAFCRNLIYPVPDPVYPFLGVHFTRSVHGEVECGPNAVLAFGREAYYKTQFSPADVAETLRFAGFRALAVQHWRMGICEMWRSINKHAFVSALQRLVPDIRSHHLHPAEAGIRAQAVRKDGNLVDDFLIERTDRAVHVLNAPSPAATASLEIARVIADAALA